MLKSCLRLQTLVGVNRNIKCDRRGSCYCCSSEINEWKNKHGYREVWGRLRGVSALSCSHACVKPNRSSGGLPFEKAREQVTNSWWISKVEKRVRPSRHYSFLIGAEVVNCCQVCSSRKSVFGGGLETWMGLTNLGPWRRIGQFKSRFVLSLFASSATLT